MFLREKHENAGSTGCVHADIGSSKHGEYRASYPNVQPQPSSNRWS
jgi:hypothetical protein